MTTPTRLREALEAALIEAPDDLATHKAYADLLMEQGDPRGEFISVQLGLEDESRSVEERQRLRQRERELLTAHERAWQGDLAPLLLGTPEERRALLSEELLEPGRLYEENWAKHTDFRHVWARGWLDRFECGMLSVELARKLGRAPLARLLRAFVGRIGAAAGWFRFVQGPDFPTEDWNGWTFELLAAYPILGNLRIFQYGQEVDPEEDGYEAGTQYERLAPLIAHMPRLEELYIFGHIYMRDEMWDDMERILSLPTLTNLHFGDSE